MREIMTAGAVSESSPASAAALRHQARRRQSCPPGHTVKPRWRGQAAALLMLLLGQSLTAARGDAAESLWSEADRPLVASHADPKAVELGVKFRSAVAGTVTGIRFYKGSANTGTHVGHLWTAGGTRLASGRFSNETASGWQTLRFAAPVVIAANTLYVASYYAPRGNYAVNTSYFWSARSSGSLTAPAAGGTGNGVYRYGVSGFPAQTYYASNYWVDVLFEPSTTTTPPPSPPPAAGGPPAGYTLAWADEFNALSLGGPGSGKNWAPYYVGWNVRHLAGNSDDAVKMADYESLGSGPRAGDALRQAGSWGSPAGHLHEIVSGQLALRGYPTPSAQRSSTFGGFPYVAGMISGQQSFAQRYGYWETRVKLSTVSKGHHLAVWLLPTDNTWPPEIDMLEVVGQYQNMMFTNSHGETPDLYMSTYNISSISADWHVLGFLWTPTTMRWTIDGKTVREHANYLTSRNLYFLVTWDIASNWPGNPDSTTRWPAEVAIDYVRIYRPNG
jgi:Domain of unknown function (DUF4082)/Glycosyl hydrolases family 16